MSEKKNLSLAKFPSLIGLKIKLKVDAFGSIYVTEADLHKIEGELTRLAKESENLEKSLFQINLLQNGG